MKKFTVLIKTILKGQELKEKKIEPSNKEKFIRNSLSIILIIIAAPLLYLDRGLALMSIDSSFTFGYNSFYDFIWMLMQSISPLFFVLALALRMYTSRWILLIPVYCYSLQLVWIFSPHNSDDFLGYLFASIILLCMILFYFAIHQLISYLSQDRNQDKEFINYSKRILSEISNQLNEKNALK